MIAANTYTLVHSVFWKPFLFTKTILASVVFQLNMYSATVFLPKIKFLDHLFTQWNERQKNCSHIQFCNDFPTFIAS